MANSDQLKTCSRWRRKLQEPWGSILLPTLVHLSLKAWLWEVLMLGAYGSKFTNTFLVSCERFWSIWTKLVHTNRPKGLFKTSLLLLCWLLIGIQPQFVQRYAKVEIILFISCTRAFSKSGEPLSTFTEINTLVFCLVDIWLISSLPNRWKNFCDQCKKKQLCSQS